MNLRDDRATVLAQVPRHPAGPRPGFVGGTIAMVGGISREDGVELDRLRDVGRFEVVNDGRPVGFTWFPVSDVVVKFDAASDEDLAS